MTTMLEGPSAPVVARDPNETMRSPDSVPTPDVVKDAARIAADLHDTVIRPLFPTTLGLLGTVAIIDNPAAAERIRQTIDDLDETIRHIRSTIFALLGPGAAVGDRQA